MSDANQHSVLDEARRYLDEIGEFPANPETADLIRGLVEQLEATEKLAEDRARSAHEQAARMGALQEQFEALKRAVQDYVNDEIGLMDVFKIAFPEDFVALQTVKDSFPASRPEELAHSDGLCKPTPGLAAINVPVEPDPDSEPL